MVEGERAKTVTYVWMTKKKLSRQKCSSKVNLARHLLFLHPTPIPKNAGQIFLILSSFDNVYTSWSFKNQTYPMPQLSQQVMRSSIERWALVAPLDAMQILSDIAATAAVACKARCRIWTKSLKSFNYASFNTRLLFWYFSLEFLFSQYLLG